MATELAKAYVQIVPSAKGIKGSITESLGGEASSAGDSAGQTLGGTLASTIKKVIAAAGIGEAIKKTLSEGANLQQSIGGIETLFKDSADVVKQYADNAYKTAGLSANDYMESVTGFSASLLQGLGGDTSKAAEIANTAITDMADNSNKMGTSMDLIQNAYQGFAKQNYTMLDNLKLGYGGTKTEMERLLADAQKISGIEYNMDNLSDVYEAIHVIQGQMDITGTTAKEAASTFSGSIAAMKSAASNFLGNLALGKDIGPSLMALTDTIGTFVSDNLIPMLGNIASEIPEIIDYALTSTIRNMNIVANNMDTILEQGMSFVLELANAIIANIPYIAEAAINMVLAFGNALLNADWVSMAQGAISTLRSNMDVAAGEILGTDGNIVKSVANAITTNLPVILSKGVEMLKTLSDGFWSVSAEFIKVVSNLLGDAMNLITANLPVILSKGGEILTNIADGFLQNMPRAITNVGELISNIVSFISENLPVVLKSGADILISIANGIVQNLPQIVDGAAQAVASVISTIGSNLPSVLQSGIEIIGNLAAGLIEAIPDIVAAIPDIIDSIIDAFMSVDWGEIGLNIVKGIAEGIKNAAGEIVEAAKDAAGGAVDSVKDFLGIHSPSRVFENQVGKMIDLGMAAGIENNVAPVTESMRMISTETVGAAETDFKVDAGIETESEIGIRDEFTRILDVLREYLPMCANQQIMLDGDILVGATAQRYDQAMGDIANKGMRGVAIG